MRVVQDLVQRLAPTELTIVLLGETGTGKDLVAQDIHRSSSRSAGPFCVLNCAAIPGTLIEGALFGHERGAFTGAEQARPGIFEQGHGGTVFLDEVGELSAAAQVALLRVLESGRVARLGGSSEIEVDARVVAATHRDLEDMVRQGTFRGDLLHRLSMATIELPPLSERRDEPAAMAPRVAAPFRARLASIARAEVQVALEKTGGNRRRAAALLGMPLRTLERHVQKLRESDPTWPRASDPVVPQPAQPQRMKRNP
jgi:transcriptional regulator with GAF, ATPase, and Fis domain